MFLLLAGCQATDAAPTPDHDADLRLAGRLVARLVADHDPGNHRDTWKVYHQVHALDGRLLTKGPGGDHEHHRGLFLGWNQTRVGAATWDFWHGARGEVQQLVRMVPAAEHGRGDGWQVIDLVWRGGDGIEVLQERRALRATALDDATYALDLHTELRAEQRVTLAGDPHHAGVQFRALQAFYPDGAPKLAFVRPAGAVDRGNDVWIGCDWTAGVLPLPGGPVTVLHCDHPDNPRPNRYSTRHYGRFGSTSAVELAPGRPRTLRYRLVVHAGTLEPAACADLHARWVAAHD